MRNITGRRIAIGAALWLGAAGAGLKAADDLPKAETLLDKYIEATGGKAVYEKNRNQMMTGTMDFSGMGMKGTMTAYRAAPDKSYAEINLGGVGKIQEGSNGTVAWSLSAMQGPHVKEGDEKVSALQLARYDAEVHWRDTYKSVQTVGVETVDGKECYKVALTPKEGSPSTRFYDKQSGLVIKLVMTLKSPMGEVSVESLPADYRKEGDFLVPHKVTQKTMGQEFTMTIDSVKYNVDIPTDRFDLPPEIQALVNKK
jgi:hypothetical protein